jgi:Flp pilus assembly protein TadG
MKAGLREKWSLRRDRKGAAALEFALIALPFILVILVTIQMGLFYMTQSAIDSGVNTEAAQLQSMFNQQNPTVPTDPAAVKANIVSAAGSMIFQGSTTFEIQQLANYTSQNMPIVDGTMNFTSPDTTYAILVLRAQSSVVIFAPGFTSSVVEASAIVRRHGY